MPPKFQQKKSILGYFDDFFQNMGYPKKLLCTNPYKPPYIMAVSGKVMSHSEKNHSHMYSLNHRGEFKLIFTLMQAIVNGFVY